MIEPGSAVLRTVASFGEEDVQLGEVPVSADASSPFGGGGTGTALREGRPVWVQDFINDPMTKPWHERGRLEGWRASAALPLRRDGVVIGVLRLYSGEVNAFDEEIRNLLTEMATDISFALSLFAKSAGAAPGRRRTPAGSQGVRAECRRCDYRSRSQHPESQPGVLSDHWL